MRKLAALVLSVLPSLALAQAPPPAAPPPEVKKTVDAFVGNWKFEGTVSGLPGMKEPLKVKETMACKKTAGGLVAMCTGVGTAAGMPKLEDVLLVTYDPGEKVMRVVGMDSMGTVHDHKCSWKDDKNVACEPLAIVTGGGPATVDLEMSFADAKTVTMKETTTAKDGTKIVFDGSGKRK